MSHDYSEHDDFDGFSDHEGSQVYVSDDVPDDHGCLYDGESSEPGSDSDDEPKDHTGFVDDEASEADSEWESENSFEPDYAIGPGTLHKFTKLPLELREMIWKTFCPDLSAEPRVYELNFDGKDLRFAAQVEDQTTPLRTVLSIHRESRALGRTFAPNLIQLPHGLGVAPCHMERDLVFVDWSFDHRYCPGPDELEILGNAAPGLQNLAFTAGVTFFDGGADLDRLYSLKNVFIGHEADHLPTRGLTWCVSENNHTYQVVHQEDVGNGLTENVNILFCWPNPDKYGETGERDFSSRQFASLKFDQEGRAVDAQGEVAGENPTDEVVSNWGWEIARLREWLDPLHEMNQSSTDQSREGSSGPEDEEQHENVEEQHDDKAREREEQPRSPPQPQRISVWPFTRFLFASGANRLEAMKAWQKPWDEWESDAEEDDYGDDSSEMDSDDSLHDFIAHDETIDLETDDDQDGASQAEDEDGSPSRAAQRQHLIIDSGDEDESSTEPGEPSQSRPRSRVVIDLADSSEEEGDAEGEEGEEDIAPQRAGGSSRRARARPIPVDSEDDDDDEVIPQPSRAAARRAAVLLSDSEDDKEGAGGHQVDGARIEEEEDSPSEEEDDEEEERMAPPPRMSLAKRLRLEAAQARAALAEDDSDAEDHDGDGRASDDVSSEDEMIAGMEEEGEDDDEEAW